MKKLLPVLSLVPLVLLTPFLGVGCASYSIQPIAASALKDWGRENGPLPLGYIFYQPELYFSATITVDPATGKQSAVVTPLYLPNYQKPYRLTTHNFLGKSDFSFNFENGWKLTQIADKADNTAVANALAGQLKTILSAAGAAALKSGEPRPPKTRTLLYRPIFDEKTGYFTGFAEVAGIDDTN